MLSTLAASAGLPAVLTARDKSYLQVLYASPSKPIFSVRVLFTYNTVNARLSSPVQSHLSRLSVSAGVPDAAGLSPGRARKFSTRVQSRIFNVNGISAGVPRARSHQYTANTVDVTRTAVSQYVSLYTV